MQGKIIKGIAGFYYVHVVEFGIYECKAKGVFRKEKIKPLVGDNVEIEVLDESEKKGNIVKILPRQNELIRPAVANIDQALVVFAITKPNPHFNLLDRFLVMMESKEIPVILCFNKEDIATDPQIKELEEIGSTKIAQRLHSSTFHLNTDCTLCLSALDLFSCFPIAGIGRPSSPLYIWITKLI